MESSQRLRDMKYIGFKHQRENKQNSDNMLVSIFQLGKTTYRFSLRNICVTIDQGYVPFTVNTIRSCLHSGRTGPDCDYEK
jgi:hypothetical protein